MAARGDGKGSVCLTAWRPAAAGGEAMMAVEEAQMVVQAPAEPLEAGAAVQGATAPLAAPSASPEPVATDGAVAMASVKLDGRGATERSVEVRRLRPGWRWGGSGWTAPCIAPPPAPYRCGQSA